MPVKTILNRSGNFEKVGEYKIRCVHACIDSGGGYFENLL